MLKKHSQMTKRELVERADWLQGKLKLLCVRYQLDQETFAALASGPNRAAMIEHGNRMQRFAEEHLCQ